MCIRVACFVGLLGACVSSVADATDTQPISVDDLANMRSILALSAPAASPSGDAVAVTVCDPVDEATDNGSRTPSFVKGCRWQAFASNTGVEKVASRQGAYSWAPAWSPDGRRLAYYSHSASDAGISLWVWDSAAGEHVLASKDAVANVRIFERPIWLDDHRILFRGHQNKKGEAIARTEAEGGTAPIDGAPKSTVVVYRSPVQQQEESDVAPQQTSDALMQVDLRTGASTVLWAGFDAFRYALSPDGQSIAATLSQRRHTTHPAVSVVDLAVYDIAGRKVRTRATGFLSTTGGVFSWSPDSQVIAMRSVRLEKSEPRLRFDSMDDSTTRGSELVFINAQNGERYVAKAPHPNFFDDSLQPPLWSPEGESVFSVSGGIIWKTDARSGETAEFARVEGFRAVSLVQRDSNRVHVTEGASHSVIAAVRTRDWRYEGFAYIRSTDGKAEKSAVWQNALYADYRTPMATSRGEVVFYSERHNRSGNVYLLDDLSGRKRRLTNINGLDRAIPGERRILDFTSANGEDLNAILVLPPGHEQRGRTLPLIALVYSGDTPTRSVNRFGLWGASALNLHILAAQGYAVLWPAIPVTVGTPRDDILAAVLPALDRVVEIGVADADRMAVMGQSNGGYTALTLLAHSDRFDAGVINAGYADLTAFYGAMGGVWIAWLEERAGAMGVAPWEDPQRYIENSPMYYLNRVNAPVLLQAGTADTTIIQYSDQVWVGLNKLGKDVTYLRYEDEGHVLGKRANIRDYYNRLFEFLDRNLRRQRH